ncbi:hypothetical protein F5890DRAFT_1589296 [Lentinula detonsa]|uniref:Uncharacterized protein n=1 Tax=Lentinula detonsa TaxID=2804962 RepID=A0AA38PQ35_9AGAR|nr:hypothetical protein F5890DRAFT_1589296 [Lentinula detonsa]
MTLFKSPPSHLALTGLYQIKSYMLYTPITPSLAISLLSGILRGSWTSDKKVLMVLKCMISYDGCISYGNSNPPTSPFRMNRSNPMYSNYSASPSGSGSGLGSTSPRRRLRGASVSNDNDNDNYNSYNSYNKTKTRLPPGFLAHKPKPTPIGEMALWELESRYSRNARVLGAAAAAAAAGVRSSNNAPSFSPSSSSPFSPSFSFSSSSPSTSSYIQRLTAEQAAIEEQLVEVHGMEVISARLRNTRIGDGGAGAIGGGGAGGFGGGAGGFGGGGGGGGDQKDIIGGIGGSSSSSTPNSIDAKKRALANFGSTAPPSHIGMLGMEEAIAIERRAQLHDLQRKHRLEQKKVDHGYPSRTQVMSREERERRVWAFMNYKPTESDLEDEEEEEDEEGEGEDGEGEGMDEDGEDDPSTWFEDDQDDGRKGQNIVEADEMDMDGLRNVIRVMDPNQLRYGTFYQPRDD